MEKRIGYNKQKSALWASLRDGDFEESDIWDDLKERKDSNESKVVIEAPDDLSVPRNRNLPSSSYDARMVPIRTSSFSSSSNSSIKGVKKQQQSAPVTIPDCSIQKKSKKKKKNHPDDSDDDDDDDEVYDCQVPPHEFIAQRVAKSQVSSFSVFEGVGRTLKGRDLSKVRDAVLTQTGFLE